MPRLTLRSAVLAVVLACLVTSAVAADPPPPGAPRPYRGGPTPPVIVTRAPREVVHAAPRPVKRAGRGMIGAAPSSSLTMTAVPATVDAGRPVGIHASVTNPSTESRDYRLDIPLPLDMRIVPQSIQGGVYDPVARTVRATFKLAGAQPAFTFLNSLAGETPALPYIDLPTLTGAPPLPQGTEGDEVALEIGLANGLPAFPYMGKSYRTFSLVSNGYVVLGSVNEGDIAYVNRRLPDGLPPNPTLAALWTDLDLGAGHGGHGEWYSDVVTGGVFGDQHALVFQWQDAQAFQNPALRYSFEVILVLETGRVYFLYARVDEPLEPTTIGAESPDGDQGTSWYFNGDPPGHQPRAGQTLALHIDPGGGHQDSFGLQFQARPMASGIFRVPGRLLDLSSGETTEAAAQFTALPPAPVTLTVEGQPDLSGYARPLLPRDVLRGQDIYAGLDVAANLAYYGLFQIPSPAIPEGATLTSATVDLMGVNEEYVDDRAAANWTVRLLQPEVNDSLWSYNWYQAAHAPVSMSLRPTVQWDEVGVGRTNRFAVTPGDLPALASRAGQTLSFRVDGATVSPWRGIFGWDGGYGGHPPMLRLTYTPPIVELP